ncbi:hypothetical protein JDS99_26660 [Bacillus cereus group sp. N6]|uniref:hypothetical protein n=1 Tax=Bacillus cereus group sp. N6 TaxID=2794583 RepID=UPI0018F5415D|nr:hypothetical protein [Bacillus cereus group sp. N6]MBJ8113157.1 hypothetical protein [Bacillus cereus group sp. N6]
MKLLKLTIMLVIIIPTLFGCGNDNKDELRKDQVTKALYQEVLKKRFSEKMYKDYEFESVCRAKGTDNTYVVKFSYEFHGEKFSHKEAISYDKKSEKFEAKQVNAYETTDSCLK